MTEILKPKRSSSADYTTIRYDIQQFNLRSKADGYSQVGVPYDIKITNSPWAVTPSWQHVIYE